MTENRTAESAYDRMRRERCRWCAEGLQTVRLECFTEPQHMRIATIEGRRTVDEFLSCTAPSLADAYEELAAKAEQAREALQFVKQFLTNLEINTQPDDPLIEIRRQVHAPLHARIDAALSAEPEAGNG